MITIKEALTGFFNEFVQENELYSRRAEVLSVDLEKNICTVRTLTNEATLSRVQISSFIGSKTGVFLIPAVDSIVTLSYYNKDEAYISKCSVLSGVKIVIGENEILIEDSQITIHGGENGGLININDLTDSLNNLVSEVNNMVSVFNSHVHITTATVGATATPGVLQPPTATQSNASNFNASDYEDTTVNH